MAENLEDSQKKTKNTVLKKARPGWKSKTWEDIAAENDLVDKELIEDAVPPEDKKAQDIADEIMPAIFTNKEDQGEPTKEEIIEQKASEGELISSADLALLKSRKISDKPKTNKTNLKQEKPVKNNLKPNLEGEREEASKMTLEEKIGEAEMNLKGQYLELFKFLKEGKEASRDIYENIFLDKAELEEFYKKQGIKDRGEFGKILDNIKQQAQEEVGYGLKNKTEGTTRVDEKNFKIKKEKKTVKGESLIEAGRKLAEKYGIKSLEELEEMLRR